MDMTSFFDNAINDIKNLSNDEFDKTVEEMGFKVEAHSLKDYMCFVNQAVIKHTVRASFSVNYDSGFCFNDKMYSTNDEMYSTDESFLANAA